MSQQFKEGIDYYYDERRLVVLTSTYHLKRGRCCGKGCKHCPYQYENVLEPQKRELLENRPPMLFFGDETTK